MASLAGAPKTSSETPKIFFKEGGDIQASQSWQDGKSFRETCNRTKIMGGSAWQGSHLEIKALCNAALLRAEYAPEIWEEEKPTDEPAESDRFAIQIKRFERDLAGTLKRKVGKGKQPAEADITAADLFRNSGKIFGDGVKLLPAEGFVKSRGPWIT